MSEYIVEQDNEFMLENDLEFFLMKMPTLKSKVDPHIHNSIEILFIVKGDFLINSESKSFTAHEGELILFRSQSIHSLLPTQAGTMYYVLKVKPSLVASISSQKNGSIYSLMLSIALFDDNAKICWTAEECAKNGIKEHFNRMAEETANGRYGLDMVYKICIGEILLMILKDLKAQFAHAPIFDDKNESFIRKMHDIILYINKHYTDDITAEECCQKLFVSYSYFSRKFKQLTGKAFKEYLTQIRINHAEKRLITTDKSITDIATECGFNSITYFSTTYKEVKGLTPSEARNKYKAYYEQS